jgi:hypothetical protein
MCPKLLLTSKIHQNLQPLSGSLVNWTALQPRDPRGFLNQSWILGSKVEDMNPQLEYLRQWIAKSRRWRKSKSHPNQLGTSCQWRHVAGAIVRAGCDLDAASAVHVLGIPRSLDLSRQIVILVKTREDLKRGVHVHLRYSFVLNVKTR